MSWARNIIWTSKNEPAWVLACLLVASPGLLADDSGVEVRRSGVKALETPPGKVITTGFVVANRNAIGGEFVETVALPPGWLKVAPAEDRFPLAARAEELRLLAILVPPTAAAGVTEVRYSVRGGEGDASVSEGRFTVRVLAVARLELLVEDKPEAVIAGEDYEVKLRVLNHGNSTNRIRLVTLASPPIETLLDLPELVLAPASAQTVSVRVKTTARIDRKVTQILSFKAVGEDGAGASTTSPAQAAVVEVIPKVTGDTDTWNRLPVQMRVVAVKETGQKAGLQAEFSGAGNLDDTGKRQTEFLFRGPDLQQKSMYGQRDEYRLSYADPLLEVQLGDRSYTVSPLLERNGYGRGAELGLHTTNNSAEILYLENRPGQTPFSEFGGNLQHRVTPWLSLQGNYLNREGSGHAYWTNGVAQSLYGLEPKLRLGTAFDLDMELAASQGQARQGGSAVAARLECHGDLFDQLHYAVEKVYAAPGFYGYYNDVDSLQSSLTFPIYGKLRGNLAYTEYRNNLEQNPLKSTTATRETTYRPGLRYTFPFRAELQIDYQHIDRADVLRPVAYDFTEDSVRVGLGRTFGPVRLQTFIEQGQLEDRVLNRTTDDLHRYSFDASYYPSPRQTYSAYASFGNSSFTSNPDQFQVYGLSIKRRLVERCLLDVSYERNTTDSAVRRQQDTARSTLSYTLRNQQSVSVQARWSHGNLTGGDETSFLLAYTIPFRLPVSKKTSVGSLKGRVFDQESSRRQPLPRVILRLNDAWAVTDRQGEFLFPALRPGKFLLRVDAASLGGKHLTAALLPVLMEIRKGQHLVLDLGVITAANLTVRVAVAPLSALNTATNSIATVSSGAGALPGSGLLTPASPINAPCEGVIIELRNGQETLQAYTATDGRASFDHLRPGPWTCKVRDNHLPAYHYVETPETKLLLAPGESRELAVRVLARQRTIQFIDSGTVE